VRRAAAALVAVAACGAPEPACPLAPGLDAAECAALPSMHAPAAPPPSPTNAHADDDAAARLGFRIFFDARFSRTHKQRCATCHEPAAFVDHKAVALGIAAGTRNAPTVLGVARRTRSFFWDGRADVLWAPPILAIENPIEMGSTRLEIAHTIAAYYAEPYAAIFGALPPLDDVTRFPAAGKPGDPAWDAMTAADQDAINRIAASTGKAIEAYLRKLATGPSAFDRWLDGDATALTDHQRDGLIAFVTGGCPTCHGGPLFTDDRFHDLGVPVLEGAAPDPGRAAAIEIERAQLFSPSGPYADVAQPPLMIADATPGDAGALRTPSLRDVVRTAPYMHNGRFLDLAAAIDFHAPIALSADDRDALIDFLGTLTGGYPDPPWNDWPDTP
jgi:cytochrome c peroxidase